MDPKGTFGSDVSLHREKTIPVDIAVPTSRKLEAKLPLANLGFHASSWTEQKGFNSDVWYDWSQPSEWDKIASI